ncbi:TPA: SAM-dependent methyltransferase [Klebsiella oxytoca]
MIKNGSLKIVGTGIRQSHITSETQSIISASDKFFYLVADTITELYLKELRSDAISLQPLYIEGQERLITYNNMVNVLLDNARKGLHVCAAFYGHPGVFVYPSHKAIKIAKGEGVSAEMFPSISAADCLYADVGYDPAVHGCVSFESTYLLLYKKKIDITVGLILWQIGIIGESNHNLSYNYTSKINNLVEYLLAFYAPHTLVCVYEASPYIIASARIEWIPIEDLASLVLGTASTLFIPPQITD